MTVGTILIVKSSIELSKKSSTVYAPLQITKFGCWSMMAHSFGGSGVLYCSSKNQRPLMEINEWQNLDVNVEEQISFDTMIHVNRQFIQMNKKENKNRPFYTLKNIGTAKSARYLDSFYIEGQFQIVHRPNEPHKCGATVWIETMFENLKFGKLYSFKEAKDFAITA